MAHYLTTTVDDKLLITPSGHKFSSFTSSFNGNMATFNTIFLTSNSCQATTESSCSLLSVNIYCCLVAVRFISCDLLSTSNILKVGGLVENVASFTHDVKGIQEVLIKQQLINCAIQLPHFVYMFSNEKITTMHCTPCVTVLSVTLSKTGTRCWHTVKYLLIYFIHIQNYYFFLLRQHYGKVPRQEVGKISALRGMLN